MLNQDIRSNINKIDFDLKEKFENVSILEKGKDLIEIRSNSTFIFEGVKKRVEIKVEINKKDITNRHIPWSYYSNSLNESIGTVERISTLDSIGSDIYNTVREKRMDSDYLESIDPIIVDQDIKEEVDRIEKIKNALSNYTTYTKCAYVNEKLNITYDKDLRLSERIKIEEDFKHIAKIDYITFKENKTLVVNFLD